MENNKNNNIWANRYEKRKKLSHNKDRMIEELKKNEEIINKIIAGRKKMEVKDK